MAEEEKNADEGKKGGGAKKLIIIIVVLLVLIGGGVGAYLALGHSKGEGEGEGEDAGEEEGHDGEQAVLPPAILPLETFIVNLQVKGSFLKATIQLEFTEPQLPPTVESDIPKVRDAIIRILSSKSSADILTSEGKEKLREEIKNSVNEALGAEDVTQIYFTEFIIQ